MSNEMNTLKKQFKQKVRKEKLLNLDENTKERLNEEIDQKLLSIVIETVKKLQTINFGSITILDEARDSAVLDVTQIATAIDKPGFINKIASFFRNDKSPVFDALAFGSAISNFFPMLSKYANAMASKGGKEVDDSLTLAELSGQSEELTNAVKNMITKGLKPSGVLANLGAGWNKKYIKQSPDELADQIMQAPISEIGQVAESVKNATKQVTQVATKAAQKNETPNQDVSKIQSAYTKIKDELGDMNNDKKQIVANVLKALANSDLLK